MSPRTPGVHEAAFSASLRDGVKILGSGELKAKANFEVATASKSAAAAIEKAGGSLKTLRKEAEKAAS